MLIHWIRKAGIACAIAAVSCGATSLEPQALPLDRVECSRCGMLISQMQHAAQAVVPGGEARFYDDRGCLAADAPSLPAGARLFAQLHGGSGWIDVAEASFAFPASYQTPMSYGLTAFRTAAEAANADRNGHSVRWGEVVRQLEQR
jgi:copper chaperone NosL